MLCVSINSDIHPSIVFDIIIIIITYLIRFHSMGHGWREAQITSKAPQILEVPSIQTEKSHQVCNDVISQRDYEPLGPLWALNYSIQFLSSQGDPRAAQIRNPLGQGIINYHHHRWDSVSVLPSSHFLLLFTRSSRSIREVRCKNTGSRFTDTMYFSGRRVTLESAGLFMPWREKRKIFPLGPGAFPGVIPLLLLSDNEGRVRKARRLFRYLITKGTKRPALHKPFSALLAPFNRVAI